MQNHGGFLIHFTKTIKNTYFLMCAKKNITKILILLKLEIVSICARKCAKKRKTKNAKT